MHGLPRPVPDRRDLVGGRSDGPGPEAGAPGPSPARLTAHHREGNSMSRKLGRNVTRWTAAIAAAVALVGTPIAARADETCQSPYMPKITGEEEYVYVWTLGVEGLGDGSDKLVTVDARKGSPTHGQVIHSVSVGGRHEAHHADFTDDRRFLWASGLDTSQIFVFDVAIEPGEAPPGQDDRRLRPGLGRGRRPARLLRPSRTDAGRRPVQRQGQDRADGHRRVHERGPVHRHALDAHRRGSAGRGHREGGGRLRVRRPRAAAEERDVHDLVHRLVELHEKPRRGAAGPGGDEALRPDRGRVELPHPPAEEGLPRARARRSRSASPGARLTTTPSPRRRSPPRSG